MGYLVHAGSKQEVKRGAGELWVSFRDDLVTWNKYEVSSKTFTGSARAADEVPQNFIDM